MFFNKNLVWCFKNQMIYCNRSGFQITRDLFCSGENHPFVSLVITLIIIIEYLSRKWRNPGQGGWTRRCWEWNRHWIWEQRVSYVRRTNLKVWKKKKTTSLCIQKNKYTSILNNIRTIVKITIVGTEVEIQLLKFGFPDSSVSSLIRTGWCGRASRHQKLAPTELNPG